MKKITHTIIRLRPDRLDQPLQTVTAGLFGAATLRVAGIPEDVAEPRITLTTPAGSTFEVYVGADGVAYVEPGMLDQSGDGAYHVWATDEHGNPTPLGAGALRVLSYPMSTPGSARTSAIPVSSVMDANGTSRRLLAVQDEFGNWTLTVGEVVENSFKLVDPTKLPADAADGDSMAVLKAKINAIKAAVKASCIAVAAAFPLLCSAAALNDIPGTAEVYTAPEVDAKIVEAVTNAFHLAETDPTVPQWAKAETAPVADFSTGNAELVETVQAVSPTPDFTTGNAELVATIEATAPAPGNYATVSNAAMNALAKTDFNDATNSLSASIASRPTKAQMDEGWWSEWTMLFDGVDVTAQLAQPIWTGDYDPDAFPIYNAWWVPQMPGYDGETSVHGTGITKDVDSLVWFAYVHDGVDLEPRHTYTATRHRVAAPVPTKPSDIGAASTNSVGRLASQIPNNITRTGTDAALVRYEGGVSTNLIYIRQATTQLAGLMTASDKGKLDGIPSDVGTTADNALTLAEAATNDAANATAIVMTWENFLDGSNVVFSITNYISGTYTLDTAKLKILELREGAYEEVYNSRDEIILHIDNFKTNEFAEATNSVIQSVNAAIDGKADKAWGKYSSDGQNLQDVSISNTVYMTAPNTVFAGGLEYERVAVGQGAVCVLTTKGAPVWTQGDEGTFKFQDDGGTNYFGFAKTDSYTVGANTDGISVNSGIVTLTYNITMSGRPCVWYKESLSDNTPWEQLNLPDGSAVSGASHAVTWEQNPPVGSQVCYINCGNQPQGFFKATVEVAGEAKFMTNMKADLNGGIICPNTSTGVNGVIKPSYNGSAVIWTWSAN